MKHFGWLRKAAASVLALAMFAAAPAALAYSDANLEAPRAKNVVIDGDLSEWDTRRCLRIDRGRRIRYNKTDKTKKSDKTYSRSRTRAGNHNTYDTKRPNIYSERSCGSVSKSKRINARTKQKSK